MGAIAVLRGHLPQEVTQLYFQLAYPQQMRRYRALRETPPAGPEDLSLQPFVQTRSIFFHLPKCAGLSVAQALYGCRAGGHLGFDAYRATFSRAEFATFFKFTFVRNPWDRLVSAYHFLRAGGLGERDRLLAACSVDLYGDFDSFLRGFIDSDRRDTILHFTPQWRFLCPRPGMRPPLDFIGRFENLQADFGQVARRLGRDPGLAHCNAGQRPRDYRSAYSDAGAAIVARVYAGDIALFGYRF